MATVLVVEDDAALSDLLRSVLEDEGYRVVIAASLAGARELLAAEPVDLLLADLVEFDLYGGPGAARALRELAGQRPVILCTGQPGAEQLGEQEALAGVLGKPFDLDELIACVQSAMPGRGQPST
jgi:DNA-binding response OmpR family regulator